MGSFRVSQLRVALLNATEITTQHLCNEAAVGARLIRNDSIPRDLFTWFKSPEKSGVCEHKFAKGSLHEVMQQVVQPLGKDIESWESSILEQSAGWFSYALFSLDSELKRQKIDAGQRILASTLLPLYRCLATGRFSEGLEQSRFVFSQAFTLVGLIDELGEDLHELVQRTAQLNAPPNEILRNQLEVDLPFAAALLRDCFAQYDSTDQIFSETALELLINAQPEDYKDQVPHWADESDLWRLAGELLVPKGNLVMPRSWTDTSVPWASVNTHWEKVSQTLAAGHSDQLAEVPVKETPKSVEADATAPLILIAEIRTANDPVFVSAVRRQLTNCRANDIAYALAMIDVKPENEDDFHSVCGNRDDGLALWQNKLVNWLSLHPDVQHPRAYVTSEGELILTVAGLDRTEVTTLLRDGLDEVLSEGNAADLAKAHSPARYHVGISASTGVGAGLTPDRMVEPAIRCLTAASRLGNASIKSIEVF